MNFGDCERMSSRVMRVSSVSLVFECKHVGDIILTCCLAQETLKACLLAMNHPRDDVKINRLKT